jgi:hypothetical protein
MFMQPARPTKQRLIAAAAVMILAGTMIGALADAKIAKNTIDPTARLTNNGRSIVVTGPIQCSGTQPTYMRVTVSQRSTGAVAQGVANITCTPDQQQWAVRITTQGNATFQEGPAIATALARSSVNGSPDDAHQWLVDITLVRE